MPESTLEQFRTAMRFSLWTWGAYWAGGGLLLLAGGMTDPVSIAVAFLLAAEFLAVLSTGILETPRVPGQIRASEWILKRPIYLLVVFVLVLAAGSFVPAAINGGLLLFAGAYLAALGLTVYRLHSHLKATGQGLFASRADQAFLLLGLAGFAALQVFLDQLIPGGVGWPAPAVAAFNWVQVAYPGLMLLAAAPFRAKLRAPVTLRLRKAAAPVPTAE